MFNNITINSESKPIQFQSFIDWINKKFKIHTKTTRPSFEVREIWWCCIGQNVGDEEFGKGKNYRDLLLFW
jgi:hypothetical protein